MGQNSNTNDDLVEVKYGMIEIEYMPTACHLCGKILVHTFVRKTDVRYYGLKILCDECITKLPWGVQEMLKHGKLPEIT